MVSHGNHLLGGEINYKFIGASGNTSTYRVSLSLYGDCSSNIPGGAYSALVGANPLLYVFKGANAFTSVNLQYDPSLSNIEITPVCPDEAGNTACVDVNNPIPGIKKFVYSKDIVLTGTDQNWKFDFTGEISSAPNLPTIAGRSLIIQNAQMLDQITGTTSVMFLEATLNNTIAYNNSTTFLSPPTPFFCLNKASDYSLGAADADNDSLTFTLIPGRSSDATLSAQYHEVTYVSPYTAQAPLPTAPGNFNFSNINGQMSFTPNQVLNCLVTNLVEEYRNGVKVGSSMREMTFIILDNCNNDAPTSPVSGIQNANIDLDGAGNLYLSVCEGQQQDISFDIHSTDPNGDNVHVSYANLPAGATVTVGNDGTPHPDIHFDWNVYEAPPGNYIFYITYQDDGCPLASRKTIAYTVRIIPHAIVFNEGTLGACHDMTNGKAWVIPVTNTPIDYNYKWVDVNGNILRNVQSTTGDSLLNLAPGTYKVYIRNSEGCGHNVTFNIDESPLPLISLPADTILCEGLTMNLSTPVQPNVNYKWNTGDTGCCIIAKTTGNYILSATNQCGSSYDSTQLEFIKCNYCLFVPNAFSPNEDGRNDKFVILPVCVIEKYQISIYNRWGQLVFTSLNPSKSWDGFYKGKPADVGTYFYQIDATLQDKTKGELKLKGDLTLIR